MKTQQIIEDLKNGKQFENEVSDWYTLNNPKQNQRIIVFGTDMKFYKTIESYSLRIWELLNK